MQKRGGRERNRHQRADFVIVGMSGFVLGPFHLPSTKNVDQEEIIFAV